MGADQTKSEEITLNTNQLNSNFYRSIWLAKKSTKITPNPENKLKLEIKANQESNHDLLDLAP